MVGGRGFVHKWSIPFFMLIGRFRNLFSTHFFPFLFFFFLIIIKICACNHHHYLLDSHQVLDSHLAHVLTPFPVKRTCYQQLLFLSHDHLPLKTQNKKRQMVCFRHNLIFFSKRGYWNLAHIRINKIK